MRYRSYSPRLASLLLAVAVSGCHSTTHTPTPAPTSPEQQQCQTRCQELHQYCLHQQQKIYQQCRELARQQAQLNYQAYYQDQLAKGRKPRQVRKSPRDFYTAWHCEQQLDCAGEDRLCQHGCGR